MNNESFFDESKEQSRVKAEIVSKYLSTWAKVVMPSVKRRAGKIAYIDLFAGPGRYKDGTKSTPLLILERAIADPDMRERLMTVFSDADPTNTNSLQQAIDAISGISSLKYKPQIITEIVDGKIAKEFEEITLVPSLSFLDPWGYKGLSCRLINSVIKDWGCDSIVFFNYNRINMGLCNNIVEEHINALFEKDRADILRVKIKPLEPDERECEILKAISEALGEMGGDYVLPFRFRCGKGKRISHHLIFVSKSSKGYDIMKGIMAKASSSSKEGIPSFEYYPARSDDNNQPYLIPPSSLIEELKNMLILEYAGRELSFLDLYNDHNVGRPYIKPNYRKALLGLETQNKIETAPPAEERPRRKGEATFAENVTIKFPIIKEGN